MWIVAHHYIDDTSFLLYRFLWDVPHMETHVYLATYVTRGDKVKAPKRGGSPFRGKPQICFDLKTTPSIFFLARTL